MDNNLNIVMRFWGITTKELSLRTGISARAIEKYRAGTVALKDMSAWKLLIIASVLGVTPEYLLGLSDEDCATPIAATIEDEWSMTDKYCLTKSDGMLK